MPKTTQYIHDLDDDDLLSLCNHESRFDAYQHSEPDQWDEDVQGVYVPLPLNEDVRDELRECILHDLDLHTGSRYLYSNSDLIHGAYFYGKGAPEPGFFEGKFPSKRDYGRSIAESLGTPDTVIPHIDWDGFVNDLRCDRSIVEDPDNDAIYVWRQ